MTRMTQIRLPLGAYSTEFLSGGHLRHLAYICGQKIIVINIYATSQVADLPRPDRRDIDMVSIALKFSGIEKNV